MAEKSPYEQLRQLYLAYHEDRCTDLTCDCEAASVVQSHTLYRAIVNQYEVEES